MLTMSVPLPSWILCGTKAKAARFIKNGSNTSVAVRTYELPPEYPSTLRKRSPITSPKPPRHYTVPEALRWGQIHAIGGDRRLAEAIRHTRLVHTFTDDAFWVSFLRFLNAHLSQLNRRDINRLVEYIYDIRFVPRRILIAGGGERQVSPAQPRFRLKGKCVKTLLADAESWEKYASEADSVVRF